MKEQQTHRVMPFTLHRRINAAYQSVARAQNMVHTLIEVDISAPRQVMREHRQRTGESLSLTAWVIACLARAIARHPHLNCFRKGSKLILLDDVTVGTLVEREVAGETVPVPLVIRAAQAQTYRHIHDQIRSAQRQSEDESTGGRGAGCARLIPSFLLRAYIRAVSRDIRAMSRIGTVGVTSTGMFASGAMWAVVPTWATVGVSVGSIVHRPVAAQDRIELREHLCLTVTFNHDVVDGGPATRFLKTLVGLLSSSELLGDLAEPAMAEPTR